MITARSPAPFAVVEASQVGEARRQILALAAAAGLGAAEQGKLALVINELGTNLIKHGGGGQMIARAPEGPPAVELLALDRGDGMASVAEAFRDGYSTAGSAGTGLGAVERLATRVDVYSSRPGGTVIRALVGADPAGGPLEIGAVTVAKAGEEVCGDAWAVAAEQECPAVMVVDGLGHGLGAADAARLATRAFGEESHLPPAALVGAIHGALRGSRGAAVSVARIDRAREVVTYAGLGNVAASIVSDGQRKSMISIPGIAGVQARTIRQFEYDVPPGSAVIVHSDGVSSRWEAAALPALEARDPLLIAAVLLAEAGVHRDDAGVLVLKS